MQLCRPLLSSVLLVAVVHLTHCTGELCEYLECISPFVATLDVVASNHVASNCVVNLAICPSLLHCHYTHHYTLLLHSSLHSGWECNRECNALHLTIGVTPGVTLCVTLRCGRRRKMRQSTKPFVISVDATALQ